MNDIKQNESIYIANLKKKLNDIVEKTQQTFKKDENLDNTRDSDHELFDESQIPSCSIADYIDRIIVYTHFSEEYLLSSYILILRYLQVTQKELTCLNTHRLFLTSLLVIYKLYDDNVIDQANKMMAKLGGVFKDDIQAMEEEFVLTLQFKLHISFEEYEKIKNELSQ